MSTVGPLVSRVRVVMAMVLLVGVRLVFSSLRRVAMES